MILEGEASDILHEWVRGRYQIFYKYDGVRVFMIEIYEPETKKVFLPNEETEYFLDIIFSN
jgi:hypothetical protein